MKWFYRFLLLLIIGMALYVTASHGGVYDLWKIKKNIARADAKNQMLLQEKNDSAAEIILLQSNNLYIEKIAREELGMVKKDDVVVYLKKNDRRAPQFSPVVPQEK